MREATGVAALPPSHVAEAAQELKARGSARKALLEFILFTFPRYNAAWFHKLLCTFLQLFLWDKMDKDGLLEGVNGIMVNMPPRHGKSETVAIRMPAFDFLEHPAEHYMTLAYGDELANTFSRACRNTIETPAYQRLKRHALKSRGDSKWQLQREDDDERASYIASGIMSSVTGEGATRLIIDDPVKNHEEAYSKKMRDKVDNQYQTTADTRMAPKAKKFFVMTRWHDDDQGGRVIKRALKDKKADQWLVIVLAATNDDGQQSYMWNTKTGVKKYFPKYPALWQEAYPREELDRKKANMAPVYWQALYQQNPVPASGSVFKREHWQFFQQRPACELMVQVYDTAFEEGQENDYSASLTIGANGNAPHFPVLDGWRDRVAFPKLVAKVYERWEMAKTLYGRYPDRILIEDKGSGISLRQQIETNNLAGEWTFLDDNDKANTMQVPFIPVVAMPARQSKIVRAQGISGYHASKGCWLPEKCGCGRGSLACERCEATAWVDDFLDELSLFDKGEHDDFADCFVHALTYYTRPVEDTEEVVGMDNPIVIDEALANYELEAELRNW